MNDTTLIDKQCLCECPGWVKETLGHTLVDLEGDQALRHVLGHLRSLERHVLRLLRTTGGREAKGANQVWEPGQWIEKGRILVSRDMMNRIMGERQ